ncbi:hypothetical protein [Brachybacterium vulturis]|uniref:hypothetical protein n=1 Tax=Brachybacterium vulturis TaxID=2017484 RepID=UPI001FE8629E|nr:hypothetical protein [Brachybacterium vulturis]
MALAVLLGGCGAAGQGSAPSPSDAGSGLAPTAAPEAEDAAGLSTACTTFWGDPEYADPLSRTVLARAASAPEVGPSDPDFFALTGDDIETAFEGAPASAQGTAAVLADWFRAEPVRGAEADLDAFRTAWEGLAASCQEVSAAAQWAVAPGEDGTKPAALVCADVFDTPGTLTHFANANVLTSNMFKLVGLSPRAVPAGREQDLRDTAGLLAAEIAAVDDDAVRSALEQVRAPFQDALEGDTWSDGLSGPLTELGTACEAIGYSSPGTGEIDNDAVLGASAGDQHGTNLGGRS